MKDFFHSELFFLLVAGFIMIVGWRIIKRGRMPGETPSILERVMMFGGIVVTITALLVLIFRSDVMEKPKGQGKEPEEAKELPNYDREPSGCSKPTKQIKEFKNN